MCVSKLRVVSTSPIELLVSSITALRSLRVVVGLMRSFVCVMVGWRRTSVMHADVRLFSSSRWWRTMRQLQTTWQVWLCGRRTHGSRAGFTRCIRTAWTLLCMTCPTEIRRRSGAAGRFAGPILLPTLAFLLIEAAWLLSVITVLLKARLSNVLFRVVGSVLDLLRCARLEHRAEGFFECTSDSRLR